MNWPHICSEKREESQRGGGWPRIPMPLRHGIIARSGAL
jgi:hypothetical protein